MRTVMSEALRRDRSQFHLVSCCEDCDHFVDDLDACSLLYPTAPHRRAHWDAAKDGDAMSFCKMFEARTGGPDLGVDVVATAAGAGAADTRATPGTTAPGGKV